MLNDQKNQPGSGPLVNSKPLPTITTAKSLNLNDFEIFIIRQLALSGGQGLSRRQLIEQLHFDPALVKQTLASLVNRGLIGIGLPTLFGLRFTLSAAGHAYAAAQGYFPRIY